MRRVLGVTWLQHLTPTPLVVAYWMYTDSLTLRQSPWAPAVGQQLGRQKRHTERV